MKPGNISGGCRETEQMLLQTISGAVKVQGRMQALPCSEQDSWGVKIRAQRLYCSACWKLYPLGSVSLKSHSKVFGEAERSLDLKEEVWIEILNAFNTLSPHVKHDLNRDMCCLTQMIAETVTLTSLAPERSHPSNTSSKKQHTCQLKS